MRCSKENLMKNTTKLLLLCLFSLYGFKGNAQLKTGDIAIVGYNGVNNPEELAIVTLAPISAGETIYITDRAWESGGGFALNNTVAEGLVTWNVTTTIPAGTVIKAAIAAHATTPTVSGLSAYGSTVVTGWSSIESSSSGDNWFIYTGSTANPTFIFGIANWSTDTPGGGSGGTPWQTSGPVTATTSYLPPSLVGDFSPAFTGTGLHGDYLIYTGTVSGTKNQLLADIANESNWSVSETTPADLTPGGAGFPGSNPIFKLPQLVATVTSSSPNNTYGIGAQIIIQVDFPVTVYVTGTPTLALNSGASVNYVSGSASPTLIFIYTVAVPQNSADLDYLSVNSLILNNGRIKDGNNNDLTFTLPTPGTAGSLGANKSIVIDTEVPLAPSTPVLATGSDSGISSTDGITRINTPVITGNAEVGARITLYDTDGTTVLGTTTADGTGKWTITSSALSSGVHNLTAKATDGAGNVGNASAARSVTIDVTSPTLLITSNVNNLKAGETATLTFTFSENPGSTFTWSGTSGDVLVTGGTVGAISGAGLTRTATFTPTAATDAGTASITVPANSYTDVAGNNGAAGPSPTLNFDTKAPAPPSTPVLAAGSDSGVSASDKITNVTTPVITGTAEAGATIHLFDTDGSTVLGMGIATDGNWSISSATLSSGTHSLTAKATDGFGNVGITSSAVAITIDVISPTLAITSNLSSLIAGETATITFTFSENPGSSFTWNGTAGDVVVTGGTLSAISGANLIRTATFTPNAGVNSGIVSITVPANSYEDLAGNNGAAGTSPNLTFDTNPPAAPSTPVLASGSDSGVSSSDQITNVKTPVITGTAEAGASVQLFDTDGTTILGVAIATDGTWSITSAPLSDGVHTLTTKATDVTGNVGSLSSALSITIDTSVPSLSITSNAATLISGQNATITFTFTEDPGASFTWNGSTGDVVVTGGTLGTISSSGSIRNATFTPNTGVNSGTASITVPANSYVDLAGNNGTAGTSPALTFDTQAATLTAVNIISNNPVVTLAQPGNTAQLTFTSSETIQNVVVTIAGKAVTPAAVGNNWTADYTFTGDDFEGPVPYLITFDDQSGNPTSPVSSGTGGITFDKTAPAIPSSFNATSGNAEIVLNWIANSETDLAKYRILYGTGTNPTTLLTDVSAGTTTFKHTGLSNGTTYYYRILAIDRAGNMGERSGDLLAVPKDNQTITFNNIAAKTYGDVPFLLGNANSSAGLPVTFTATDPSVVNITGNTATILKAGSTIISATQAGNSSFNMAAPVAHTLTVNPKSLTITSANREKIYGEVVDFTGTNFIVTGLINGNTVTSVTLNSPGAVATAAVSGSPYAIIPSDAMGTALNNYNINYVNSSLTVIKKDLTITAEDKEKLAGSPNPELTVKYSEFANGETNAVFTTQPSITTTANTTSPVGANYPINVSGAVAENYNFIYIPGKLEIKPGAPTSIAFIPETLYENSTSGTNAGSLSSTADVPDETFSYTLVSGSGDTDNSLFAIAGNKINTTSVLDFEDKATYSIRVRSTTGYGSTLEKVISIVLTDVNEIPTLAAIGDQSICHTTTDQTVALAGITAGPDAGQSTTLFVSSSNPGLFENLAIATNGITNTVKYRIKSGTSAGTAVVTVTVKDNGGTTNGGIDTYSSTFVVTVNPLPIVTISSIKGIEISKGDQISLTATGGNSYVWAPHSSIIGGLTSATIEVRPLESTTYTVTATNASGCAETKTFKLTVLEDYQKVQANNILTPNNDGYNDKWVIENIDFYPDNQVKIFDKAGRILYSKKGYDNSWDGSYNSTALAEGTYYYIIEFGARQRVFKGFITIVKND